MIIDDNTTIVDLALNLSGSVAGIPAVLSQLPTKVRVGFDSLPDMWEDVSDVGQTWTPTLAGLDLRLDVPLYNVLGKNKAPYTTNLYYLAPVVSYGEQTLETLKNLIS